MSTIDYEQVWLGYPVELFPGCTLKPITVELVYKNIGKDSYTYYCNLLKIDNFDLQKLRDEKGEEIFPEHLTPFQYLLLSAEHHEQFFLDLTNAFSTFIQEEILLLPGANAVVIGDPKDKCLLTEKEFFDFQNYIRVLNGLPEFERPPEDENPIQRKFRLKKEYREKVKNEKKSTKDDGLSFKDIMSSVIHMQVGITPLNIGQIPMYTVKELFTRGQYKIRYEQDYSAIIAGASPKNGKIKPEFWVADLDKYKK